MRQLKATWIHELSLTHLSCTTQCKCNANCGYARKHAPTWCRIRNKPEGCACNRHKTYMQWCNFGRDLNRDCLRKCRPIYIGFLVGNSSGNRTEPWIRNLCTRSGSTSPWQVACALWKDLLLLQSVISDIRLCSLLQHQNLALIQHECNHSPTFSVILSSLR